MPQSITSLRDAYRRAGAEGVVELVAAAAHGGDSDAQYWMGIACFLGLERPDPGPQVWFERAARQGHLEALFRLATMLAGREGDAMLIRAGEAGVIGACAALGVKYATGEWTLGRDLVQARRWYLLGAENGVASCQYETGLMLIQAEGGPRDLTAGMGWLLRAAAKSSIDAVRFLELLFLDGIDGLPASPAMADVWHRELERIGSPRIDDLDPIGVFAPSVIGQR